VAGIVEGDRTQRYPCSRLRDPGISAGIGQFVVIQAAAPAIGIDVRPINVREVHRELIARLAATNKLASVGPIRSFVESGGLVSYGANFEDQYRRAGLRLAF